MDAALGDAGARAVEDQLAQLSTREVAGAAWRENGAIIHASDLHVAADLANRIAAEHLELAIADPDGLLPEIRHAGAVFLGHHTPEALGD